MKWKYSSGTANTIRHSVLIVDDQTMTRQLFASILKENKSYELKHAFSNTEDAVDYCHKNNVDLVLLDVVMREGMNGLEAAKEIKCISPKTKIIIVTFMPEVSYIRRAHEIGVESFWYKEVQQQPIIAIMDRTMAGESIYPDTTPVLTIGNASSTDFTKTELLVLREMTTGATDTEIAERLSVSAATVRTHVQHMLHKTGHRNRVELAIKARLEGLVISD